MINDTELLRRYVEEKSEPAFTELVQRHVNFVYACALRRVRNPQLAEDVTQQVFIATAQKSASLMTREVLGGWLYTTARNVSVQIVRREQRRQVRETKAQIISELTMTPVNDVAWQRLEPVLDEGLDQLSDSDREAVLLRFLEGKSFSEIGARLRLSENAARMRVDRALERMRSVLERRGVTSTSAALALALANQAAVAAPAGLAATVTGAAFAAAAGTTAGVFAVFTSMSTIKIMTGAIIALVVAGTIASAVHEPSQSTGTVSKSAPPPAGDPGSTARSDIAAVPASVPSGGSTSSPATRKDTPVSVGSAKAKAGESAVERQARRDVKTEANRAAKQAERREIKQAVTEANRTAMLRETIVRRLTPVFQQLSLTSEQQEKLVVLAMNQHESTKDLAAANAREGIDISEDSEAYWNGKMQMRAQFQAEAKALLGENGYAVLLANDIRVGQEAVIEHLQKRLTPGGAQLSEAQAGQLLALLRERDTWNVDDDVLDQASGFLSAAQMDILQLEAMRQGEGPLKPAVQKVIKQNFGGATLH